MSIDAEKVFNKIQKFFHDKSSMKLGVVPQHKKTI
jgi:hypothetical protein